MEMPKPATDSSFESTLDSAPVKLPTTPELFGFFNQFLIGWLNLSAQMAVGLGDEVPNLPLEKGLLFSKPINGILVIRTVSEFEDYLKKNAKVDEAHPRDMFVELFVLFWHKFVSKFWSLDSRKLPPSLFKKSIPLDWPNRKTEASLQVFVGNYPLGIRLWVNLTEEEINHWRGSKK